MYKKMLDWALFFKKEAFFRFFLFSFGSLPFKTVYLKRNVLRWTGERPNLRIASLWNSVP